MLKQLSSDLATLVAQASPRLVHIGGPGISGRTGVVWSDTVVVTLAREASDGESVPVVLPGGTEATATVEAFDARTGLTLLALQVPGATRWIESTLPAVGSLAVTVAFASPGGVEARLDLVRFVGGASDWGRGAALKAHFQTDGAAYPGFSSAAVVDADGQLLGLVAENRSGNAGFVVPVAELAEHVQRLLAKGTRKRPYLGVNTRPTGTEQGLAVTEVEAGSPAEHGGLKAGDLLLSLGGQNVSHPMQLAHVLAQLEANEPTEAKVLRAGTVHALSVVLGGR